MDYLLLKPDGLFYAIDDATKARQDAAYILGKHQSSLSLDRFVQFHLSLHLCTSPDHITNKKSGHVMRASGHEFSVAHYTGKVTYDARELADKNRDFVPPEMVRPVHSISYTRYGF